MFVFQIPPWILEVSFVPHDEMIGFCIREMPDHDVNWVPEKNKTPAHWGLCCVDQIKKILKSCMEDFLEELEKQEIMGPILTFLRHLRLDKGFSPFFVLFLICTKNLQKSFTAGVKYLDSTEGLGLRRHLFLGGMISVFGVIQVKF